MLSFWSLHCRHMPLRIARKVTFAPAEQPPWLLAAVEQGNADVSSLENYAVEVVK